MNIVIPSANRADRVFTHEYVPPERRDTLFCVVPPKQVRQYQRHNPTLNVLPCPVEGHAGAFKQWIFDEFDDDPHLTIADDDLKFFFRTDLEHSPNLVNIRTLRRQQRMMWNVVDNTLTDPEIPWVGISYRMGSNNVFVPYKDNTRSFSMWAVHRPTFIEHGIRFDHMQVMEDMYCILSLLTRGYRNRVWYRWSWNGLSNSKGGCSTWRTREVQNEGARRLHEAFPEFVQVVDKTPKSECWYGRGETHQDVRVSWQKAFTPR